MRRPRGGHRHRLVTPLGADVETMWKRLLGRRVGRRLHHALRRQQLSHQDLGRSPRLGPLRGGRGSRRLEVPGPAHPFRRRRRQEGRWPTRASTDASSIPPASASTPAAARASRISTASREMMVAGLSGGEHVGRGQVHQQGPGNAAPHRRVGAGAQHAGRPPGQPVRRPGAERQLPDGLRRQQPGDRRGGGDHPPRRGRRHALRRHAHHDPSLRRDRLQPADRPEHPQRRSHQGLAPLRPQPRRLRAGRRAPAWWSSKTWSTPEARGAKIYGEIVGYGSTADAFRITDTHPEGRGAISCIQMALDDAGLDLDDVDYINAHGTSTTVNDKVETPGHQAGLRRAGLQDSRSPAPRA